MQMDGRTGQADVFSSDLLPDTLPYSHETCVDKNDNFTVRLESGVPFMMTFIIETAAHRESQCTMIHRCEEQQILTHKKKEDI